MKLINKTIPLAFAFACLAAPLHAQDLTPVPDHFTDWTGAVDNDFFNPGNWSTGIVPDGGDVAIRLPGDSKIPNKYIIANHTGSGDKTIQLYSIQTGVSKVYTIEFSGNCVRNDDGDIIEENWLVINPVGKGFTFNGIIGTTNELGLSYDITYPGSQGDNATRLAAYYILNAYSRITLDGSTSGIRMSENGLASGIFTLRDNARMDLSMAGDEPFVYQTSEGIVSRPPGRQDVIHIGGLLETSPGSVIYVGNRYANINSKLTSGQTSVMGGLLYGDPVGNNTCDVWGDITRMTGIVNFQGDGRAQFRIRNGAQYLVEGTHNGNIRAFSNAVIGGSGVINGSITVDAGGLLTPGQRGSTVGNSPDTPLIINAGAFDLQGSLGFDLVTDAIHDRLDLTITSTMTIHSPSYEENGRANLVIGMADSFKRTIPAPVTYELMTITSSGTGAAILGDFGDNVTLPASMTLKTSWEWDIVRAMDPVLGEEVETKRTLLVTLEQMPFASPAGLAGKYLAAAQKIDEVYNLPDTAIYAEFEPLYESLNRQPSITLYQDVLDQLTPSTYQAWFPSAIVRTNALVQSQEDRMYQDAAFKRKKGSVQLYIDGYRQEASRGKNELASYSNYGIIGTTVGADYAIGENFVAGGFIGYDYTDFDLDTVGGTCDVKSLTAGLKARYNMDNLQFNLTAFYGADDYTSKRTVAMTGLADWADADTKGTRLGAAASIAYTLKPAWFEVTPVVGLQWLDWKADGFQERNGGQAALYVYKQSATSQLGKIGVRIARSFPLKHGILRPYFHYSWLHEFNTSTRTLDCDLFAGVVPDPRRSIEAPATNANGWRMDIGLDWNVTRKLRGELRYQSEYRGAANESVGVRAGVNYTF